MAPDLVGVAPHQVHRHHLAERDLTRSKREQSLTERDFPQRA